MKNKQFKHLKYTPAQEQECRALVLNAVGGNKMGNFGERSGGFGRNFGGPRQEFDAVCGACGKACKVPFQPKGDRPVYCRDCFQKNKPNRY